VLAIPTYSFSRTHHGNLCAHPESQRAEEAANHEKEEFDVELGSI